MAPSVSTLTTLSGTIRKHMGQDTFDRSVTTAGALTTCGTRRPSRATSARPSGAGSPLSSGGFTPTPTGWRHRRRRNGQPISVTAARAFIQHVS